ncbi:MAG: RNase adapter RapZ [Nitriliruptorales bacterium]|nr:RNase adapter RapZ [Nitriliruptorales bacterium]
MPAIRPQLAVITGLSGAGRTTASAVLEDLGFFVIDNLPVTLIDPVIDLATAPGSSVDRFALVVDVRGRQAFGSAEDHIDDLRDALQGVRSRDVDLRMLFLEASDDALVRRFEAGRRVHPMARQDRILDGIEREREYLGRLREESDLIIDTSALNVHELRARLSEAFGETGRTRMVVNILSFGFKNGTPRDADMVLDVRFLPNPHWVDELRPMTGRDEPVRDYVLGQPDTGEFIKRSADLFDLLVPAFIREGKHYLTVAIGCTGGKHRSVVLSHVLADHMRTLGVAVRVDHRDVGRE